MQRHGQRVTVIGFCLLGGLGVPAAVKYGLEPRDMFATIVLVTLPYSASLTLALLYLFYSDDVGMGKATMVAVILMVGFAAAAYLHLGLTDADAAEVSAGWDQVRRLNDMKHPKPPPMTYAVAYTAVLVHFYYAKYGAVLFAAATAAAVVNAWNIVRWRQGRQSA